MTAARGATVARNIGTSYGIRALRALSVLVLTPYLFRRLGVEGFGTWSVLFTVATIFTLGEYGATQGVTKYVSALHGKGETARLRDLLSAAVVFMLWLGVLALIVSVALAAAAGSVVSRELEQPFQVGLVVIGATMLIRFPAGVYGAALMGAQRYDLYNAGDAISVLAFMGGAVAAVELGWGIGGLSAAYAASLLIGSAALALLLRRVDPALVVGPRRVDAAARRAVMGFGGTSLLVDSMDFIAMRMDTLVVATLRSAGAAAPIAAATRVTAGVQALILPFVSVLLPMISELHAAGRSEEVRRRLLLSTRVAMQITVVTAGGIALFAEELVRQWLGPEAPDVTAPIVAVLMLVQILILTANPAMKVLLGIGRLRALRWLAVAEGIANLALSITLVSVMGALGAAIATLVTSGLLVPVRIPLACRATGCSSRRLLAEALLPATRGAAPALAVMVAGLVLLEPGVVRLVVGLGGGLAVGAAAAAVQIGPRRLLAAARRPRTVPDVAESGG